MTIFNRTRLTGPLINPFLSEGIMSRKKDKMKNTDFMKGLKNLGIKDRRQIEIFMYIMTNTDPNTNLFIGTYKKIS